MGSGVVHALRRRDFEVTRPGWAEGLGDWLRLGGLWRPTRQVCRQCGNVSSAVASLLSAAVTAQVKGRLADQLQAALEHRWLIEQAKGVLMGRERVDAQAAFERLRRSARSSGRRVADVAREVTAGKPLPKANRPGQGQGPWDRADQQDQPGPDS